MCLSMPIMKYEITWVAYGWSGKPARRHGHKSKQRHGQVGEEGKQACNFQVPTLSSFHSRKEGRKEEGRKRAAALAADGMRERRIRFGAEKIHIKGVACSGTMYIPT